MNKGGVMDADELFDEFEDRNSPINKLTSAIIGAAIEVHEALGPGHPESAYENAMCIELELRGIAFQRQLAIELTYKGRPVGTSRIDLLVEGIIVVELKAVEMLSSLHSAQVISYLKCSGKHLGLLINFNVRKLKEGVKRIAHTR
jgi:GxxExxY protein